MEEIISLDLAWKLIGEACYAYENKQARLALMLVRGSVAEKDIRIKDMLEEIIDLQQYSKH